MRTILSALLLTSLTLLAAGEAGAVTIQSGTTGGFDDDNVISASCDGGTDGPALTITGCLQSSHSTLIDFTSTEPIVFEAGGQAKVASEDGDGFTELTIDPQGALTFQTLILNINAVDDGFVEFDILPGETFELTGNGNNFFSISGGDFSSISLTTTIAMEDVRQIRLGIDQGGDDLSEVPAPASALLIGFGLTGLWVARRRIFFH